MGGGGSGAEDTAEDGVDGAQLPVQVEGEREGFLVEELPDVVVGLHAILKT